MRGMRRYREIYLDREGFWLYFIWGTSDLLTTCDYAKVSRLWSGFSVWCGLGFRVLDRLRAVDCSNCGFQGLVLEISHWKWF